MKRIVCLLAMILAVGLAAFAQFNTAINISNTAEGHSYWPQVAFGNDGILHVVWAEYVTGERSQIRYATYDGTTISTPIGISPMGQHKCYFPFISMNNNGLIAVIYEQGSTHMLVVFDPETKTWGEPEMVADALYGNGYLSKPKVTVDAEGNIYTFFFGGYKCYSRAKINGNWEGIQMLNMLGVPAKEGGISAAPDGKIWVVYTPKAPAYRIAYKMRTKNTPWESKGYVTTLGKEQACPFVNCGYDSVPYVSYQVAPGKEGSNYICLAKIDGDKNPAKIIAGPSAFHYARVVTDSFGAQHIAVQYGQGGHGLGVQYFTNESGEWKAFGILPHSQGWPKLPGIAAEAYGNVAVSYEDFINGFRDAFVSTRYPVAVKHFYPPTDRKVTISYSGIMSGSPSVTYSLSWSKNAENNDNYIGGYKIYKKVNGGDWEFVLEVSKDTLSYDFVFTSGEDSPMTQKWQFGISAVSTVSFEGEIGTF